MKQNEFSELINRFYKFDKFKIYFLFVLSFLSGIFEFIGLALIFQFVLFLLNPNSIYSQKILFIFNNYFNIYDFSKISLMLGLGITFVYISKNLFMIFFTKYNNKILEDLSLKITMKILKNFLYQNFLTVNSIPKEEKLSLLNKITVVIWQYCLKYIHFYTNIIIAIILISFLFYKFTTLAIFASLFIGFLAFIEYKFLKNKS